MITLNNNNENISGSIDGKSYSVPYSKEAYDKLKSYSDKANNADNRNSANAYRTTFLMAVKKLNEAVKEEAKIVVGSTGLSLEHKDGQFYLFNGKSYSKFYVPTEIVGRIQESESKGIDATPFYKFFALLLRNPVMTQDKANRIANYISKTWIDQDIVKDLLEQGMSQEEAVKQATVYQVGITQEGLLVTYKVSELIGERSTDFTESDYDGDESDCEDDDIDEVDDIDISEVTNIIDKANTTVDDSLFVYQPVRNKKGHFWKKGSDEYNQERNRQLDLFKSTLIPSKVAKEVVNVMVEGRDVSKTVVAEAKFAEDYTFQPPYQGNRGDAFYCGKELGHIIKVGKVHYLPSWAQVNCDDSNSGVKGLHVGGLDYIQGIHSYNESRVVHNIFVSPEHIGAVVSVERGDGAMRVKQYFVHSSFIGPNKGLYHSSTYASQTNEQWDAQIATCFDTIDEANQEIARLNKAKEFAQGLINDSF